MRPGIWERPVEPSPTEQAVIRAVRRARLFVFLRRHLAGAAPRRG